jgi:hypothetical protein
MRSVTYIILLCTGYRRIQAELADREEAQYNKKYRCSRH